MAEIVKFGMQLPLVMPQHNQGGDTLGRPPSGHFGANSKWPPYPHGWRQTIPILETYLVDLDDLKVYSYSFEVI